MKNLVIADQDPKELSALTSSLRKMNYSVFATDRGDKALELVRSVDSGSTLLTEIDLQPFDGYELCRRIRADRSISKTPILVYTHRLDTQSQIKAFREGADDVVAKTEESVLLLSRLDALESRLRRQSNPDIISAGSIEIDQKRYIVFKEIDKQRKPFRLPKKEFELLKLFAENPGMVFSRKELLEILWNGKLGQDTRTVDAHVGKLRGKLGKTVIETVTGVGYRFSEEM